MDKNIKSYATSQNSTFPGKGREALWPKVQKVQLFWLKYINTPSLKITIKILKFPNSLFRANLQRIMQNSLNLPNNPANYTKFATKFMHIN